jgi:AraC family 4-hydroxyphenylacetate 3-monooxygenase operon regulatory protein
LVSVIGSCNVNSPVSPIPDIHITRAYKGDPDCDVHYETFSRLAEIFGRNTPAHRHSLFYQVHLLTQGRIHLNLDDQVYGGDAPLLFVTPPAVPHAFYSEDHSDGHVVTVRQEVVRSWFAAMPGQWNEAPVRMAAFMPLGDATPQVRAQADHLLNVTALLRQEFHGREAGRSVAVRALGQCFFIGLHRLLAACQPDGAGLKRERGEDVRVFLNFCDLIEAHFLEHLTIPDYARRLKVTAARLNDVCRRIANLASKELVHERVLQEARRLLRFSAISVSELSYQLGFTDPAYFSRFFTRRTGVTPSRFRVQHQREVH